MDGSGWLGGVGAALAAGLIWSLGPGVIGRYGGGWGSHVLNMVRSFYAVLFLAALIPLLGYSFAIDASGLLVIYISALFGPLLGDTLYIEGIKRIGGGNAVSIGYMYIFFAQALSHILYGEPLAPRLVLGTVVAVYGVHLVYSGEKHRLDKIGLAAAASAAASWGLGASLSRMALMYGPPVTIAFYRNLMVTASLLPFTLPSLRQAFRDRDAFIVGVVTGGLGFGAGMSLFLYAISRIGVGATALSTSITPVLGRIIARYLAHEKPSRRAYTGTAVTALGIAVGIGPF